MQKQRFSVENRCLFLCPPDHAAGDFCARVACGLGMEIIRSAVDDHGPPDDIRHGKAVGQHRQIRPAVAKQQRRQVSRVPGMRFVVGVIMSSRV